MGRKPDLNRSDDIHVIQDFAIFLRLTGNLNDIPEQLSMQILSMSLSASFGSGIVSIESLEPILEKVTFDAKDLKLWKPRRPRRR